MHVTHIHSVEKRCLRSKRAGVHTCPQSIEQGSALQSPTQPSRPHSDVPMLRSLGGHMISIALGHITWVPVSVSLTCSLLWPSAWHSQRPCTLEHVWHQFCPWKCLG